MPQKGKQWIKDKVDVCDMLDFTDSHISSVIANMERANKLIFKRYGAKVKHKKFVIEKPEDTFYRDGWYQDENERRLYIRFLHLETDKERNDRVALEIKEEQIMVESEIKNAKRAIEKYGLERIQSEELPS